MPFPAPGAVPTLTDYQFWYGGLAFGGIVVNAPYNLQKAAGLDLPPVRGSDSPRPRDEGEFVGLHLFSGRDITMDLIVVADAVSLQHAADTLQAALVNPTPPGQGWNIGVEWPLYYQAPGGRTLVTMARLMKLNWPLDYSRVLAGGFVASLQFHCTDPRWYLAPITGTDIPVGGTAVLNNSGTAEMRPTMYIHGPATNPAISNHSLTGTPTVTLTRPAGGTTILSGDYVQVDMDLHDIVYVHAGLGTSASSWVTTGSTWWLLPPGASTVGFAASGTSGVTSCQAQWSPAYLSA